MNAAPLVVGLDIGTTKVCTLVGALTEDHRVDVRGVGLAPSVGLRKGLIVDLEATVEAVKQSQEQAQRMAGQPLTGAHVYVGVTGDHVESFTSHGAIDIHRTNNEILPQDVDRVSAAAAQAAQREGRISLLEQTREFTVDGRGGIGNPVHMTGRRLEVALHVVTGEQRFLEDVRTCVQRAGLPDDSLVLEAVATGEAVTKPDEREIGVCVLDIGGGTTDLAVYLDGRLAHTSAIPVGGAHVTYDLSYGLEAPYELAEQLKKEHACAVSDLCDPEVKINYRNVHQEPCQADQLFISQIVGPRMEELFELVLADLDRAGIAIRQLGAGVVLSGGASRLSGTLALSREVLQVMVREGQPLMVGGAPERVAGPQFSTAVGLVRLGGLDQIQRLQKLEQASFTGRLRTLWRGLTRLFE